MAADGEEARSESRLQRMRSGIFGGNDRQDEVRPLRRRSTLVEALLRPQKSLLNLIGRRDTAGQAHNDHFGVDDTDVSEAHSVNSVRAVVDQEIGEGEPRESVEETVAYSEQTESDSDTSTLRGNADRRTSSDSVSSVQTVEHGPRRALRRTSEFFRRSIGNLRQTALLDSLRDVESSGQMADDAPSALNGGVGSSIMGDEAAVAGSGAAESGLVGIRQKLSRLGLALRDTAKAGAPVNEDELISPKTGVPENSNAGPSAVPMETCWRNAEGVNAYQIADAIVDPDKRNDSAEVVEEQTKPLAPEVEAEIAHLDRMLEARPEMTSTRSRSSTIECEIAFDPNWRPDDPREYSRRHRLSSLHGSETVDMWEVVKSKEIALARERQHAKNIEREAATDGEQEPSEIEESGLANAEVEASELVVTKPYVTVKTRELSREADEMEAVELTWKTAVNADEQVQVQKARKQPAEWQELSTGSRECLLPSEHRGFRYKSVGRDGIVQISTQPLGIDPKSLSDTTQIKRLPDS